MRIVLSGGWGYGNLGDDAILDATIAMLRRRYERCSIDVLTYDIEDTRCHASADVRLHLGMHRAVDLGASAVYCPRIAGRGGRLHQARVRAAFALTETRAWFGLARHHPGCRRVQEVIRGADLFVLAGGGYLNEHWRSKSRAQLHELRLASRLGVPTWVLGPTVGRFRGELARAVRTEFDKARIATFRDSSSRDESGLAAGRAALIPDIALSTWLADPPHRPVPHNGRHNDPQIGLIFTSADDELRARLTRALVDFVAERPQTRITLYLSRLWRPDFVQATRLQALLQQAGTGADLVLASDFRQLERSLAACDMVVSENLHGLILAARNAVPVMAINNFAPGSPNHRKFVAFLQQAASEDMFVDASSTAAAIVARLRTLSEQRSVRAGSLASLRSDVAAQYAELLAQVPA